MKSLIFDTGPIVAALDSGDPDHARCRALVEATPEPLIPAPILVEINYWVHARGGGSMAWQQFVSDVVDGSYRIIDPVGGDLLRAAALEVAYDDVGLGFVDASVIAICERLGRRKVATLDRRHFSVVRPRHCDSLELLPG